MKNQLRVRGRLVHLVLCAVLVCAGALVASGCGAAGQARNASAAPSRGASASPAPPAATSSAAGQSDAAVGAPASPFASGDLGDYPAPTPVDTVARVAEVPRIETHAVATSAANKAVEVHVDGFQEVAALNGRSAPPGRIFLVLDTSWKNIIPLQPAKPKPAAGGRTYGAGGLGFGLGREAAPAAQQPAPLVPTPYLVGEVQKHVWLVTDERYADPIDAAATMQVPGHLPIDRFTIARLNDVLKGKVVFDLPAGARYAALLFLDTNYGHALVPVKGTSPGTAAPKTVSGAQRNDLLELAVTEAGWATGGPQPPDGFRYFVVGLTGLSRSAGNIVQLEMNKYLFVQTEQGFVAQPEASTPWLARPFSGLAPFLPVARNEGQAAFLLPAETRHTMVLVRPPAGGALDLPAPDEVRPAWPSPAGEIVDGRTLTIHRLPTVQPPAGLPPPPAGKQHVVLDLVAQNLQPKGVELQPLQQFRLQDAAGVFYPPLPDTNRLAFHLTGRGVVPAGTARRFQLLYAVPSGQAMRLVYRGFEKMDTIDLR